MKQMMGELDTLKKKAEKGIWQIACLRQSIQVMLNT